MPLVIIIIMIIIIIIITIIIIIIIIVIIIMIIKHLVALNATNRHIYHKLAIGHLMQASSYQQTYQHEHAWCFFNGFKPLASNKTLVV